MTRLLRLHFLRHRYAYKRTERVLRQALRLRHFSLN